MIATLDGVITEISTNNLVIEVNGVGYMVYVGSKTLLTFSLEDKIKLHTVMVVREDSQTLYGFLDKTSKKLFTLVQSVSGVGPKMALEITNTFSYQELRNIISEARVKDLTAISGVGKKVAERLNIELKDKLELLTDTETTANNLNQIVENDDSMETKLIVALEGLGFDKAKSTGTVKEILKFNPDISIQQALKQALASLGK